MVTLTIKTAEIEKMETQIVQLKKGAFLCCLLILLACNSRLYSQVIYTDIPDATPNVTYSLDLNNDAIIDFSIQFEAIDKVMCKALNNNAYAGNLVGGIHLPWAIASSNSICNTLSTWYDATTPGTMAWGTSIGYWVGASDKYLALKLVVGANTYYGWARLTILPTSTSFTIKDYAYESTPNTCIQAGQRTVGTYENTNKNTFSTFPNPFSTATTLQISDNLKNATLTICNTYGQTVKQINNISGQTVTLYRDNLPSGLYFMHLIAENKIIASDKLIITD